MNFLRKFGLVALGVVFCFALFAATSHAQRTRGNDNWRGGGNSNRDRNWQNDQYGARRYGNRRYYGYGRVTPQEYRRLQRQRYRLYNQRNRYYENDGYLSDRERRRLQNRYNRYRRNVYRDRRDW